MERNTPKIYLQYYMSNGYLNPLSKLNSEKVKKRTYFQSWFDVERDQK